MRLMSYRLFCLNYVKYSIKKMVVFHNLIMYCEMKKAIRGETF